ncbi:MAG: hypothetical protein WAN74_07850 [Thermoplasmata archaeon]
MNKFEAEFWSGAREATLAIRTYVTTRKPRGDPVPKDILDFVDRVLQETGEKRNRDFREALGLVAPEPA